MSDFKNDLIKFTKVVEWRKKSCTLKVKSYSEVGYLYYKDGSLIAAEVSTLRGKQAVFNILEWDDVTNELNFSCKYDAKSDNDGSYSQLILDNQKDIFYRNLKQPGKIFSNKEGDGTMGTVWDAILKSKDRQENENKIVSEEKVIELKEISNENTISISETKEKGEEMENMNGENTGINNNIETSRIDSLNKVLTDLKKISYDIKACAVASEDGLIIASNLPEGLNESSVAAMSAAMLSMGERISDELQCSTVDQLFIKGSTGYIAAMRAGSNAILLVLAQKDAKPGLIFLDLTRAAEKVDQILQGNQDSSIR